MVGNIEVATHEEIFTFPKNLLSVNSGFPGELYAGIIRKSSKEGNLSQILSVSNVLPLLSVSFSTGSIRLITMLFFSMIAKP